MTVVVAVAAVVVVVVAVAVVAAAAVAAVVVAVAAVVAVVGPAAAGCLRTRWDQTCAFWERDALQRASLPPGVPVPWRKLDRTLGIGSCLLHWIEQTTLQDPNHRWL